MKTNNNKTIIIAVFILIAVIAIVFIIQSQQSQQLQILASQRIAPAEERKSFLDNILGSLFA